MNARLIRDIDTPIGTYCRGLWFKVLDSGPGWVVIDLGLDRHAIPYALSTTDVRKGIQ